MAKLKAIVEFLDGLLPADSFHDSSNNGLQVENDGDVQVVCCGVDASLEFFKEAQRRGADLVVCHHGVSWNDSLKRLTDLNYRRVGFLMRNNMALYASHLPLDAHPRIGNNAGMARALGLRNVKPFGFYGGQKIGIKGLLPRAESLDRFAARMEKAIGNKAQVMAFGKRQVRSVAMVVGGGAVGLAEAMSAGVDVYVSGEPNLSARNLARDGGINAVFGGHYATECFGVKTLASLLARRFRVRAEFVPMGITY